METDLIEDFTQDILEALSRHRQKPLKINEIRQLAAALMHKGKAVWLDENLKAYRKMLTLGQEENL
jgi:hypothetical protein